MAVITVNIPNVAGESVVAGHAEQLDAMAIRESLEVAVAQGTARNVGQAKHSDVELVRYRDMASPKLAEACAAGENLGIVQIYLFRTQGAGVVPFMRWELTDTYVSRIEVDTRDERGESVHAASGHRHVAAGRPDSAASRLRFRFVARFFVVADDPAVAALAHPHAAWCARQQEVERVWLNPTTVKWTYTPYVNGVAGGVVEKAWNIKTGAALG